VLVDLAERSTACDYDVPMDENAAEESTGLRDVIDETRYFTLAETDAGWAVWDRSTSSEEPVVVFPADDDGFALASDYFTKANRESRIRHGLGWVHCGGRRSSQVACGSR
jgi:hypothetical protein